MFRWAFANGCPKTNEAVKRSMDGCSPTNVLWLVRHGFDTCGVGITSMARILEYELLMERVRGETRVNCERKNGAAVWCDCREKEEAKKS